LTGAITAFQKAIALDPRFAPAHHSLSIALRTKGDRDGAVGAYHKAIALDPKNVWAHFNLGNALSAKGDLDGAIAAYQKAILLDPKLAPAHNNLGNALANKGDWDGAIGAYQKAIGLDPNYALAHCNLGDALFNKGDLYRALAASQKAIALDPKLALAHNNLGNALKAKGDLDGAMAAYQKAIDLDFSCAQAHCNLGLTLGERGQLTAALEALRRGHELGSRKPGWNPLSTQILAQTQRLVTAETKLPDFLRGAAKPANAAEALTVAQLCHLRKRYAAAVRFAAEALAAKPKLGDNPQTGSRYLAAGAAVLAAAGQGIDAADLSEEERGRLRQQALDWLRADLTAWTRRADQTGGRLPARQALRHWQKNPGFASVREAKELAKLPKADREAWKQLWTDVAALLERTR
jgi:tetratricopeptide (TPR) repeat protein